MPSLNTQWPVEEATVRPSLHKSVLLHETNQYNLKILNKKTVGQGDKGRQAVPASNKGAQRSMHVFT